MCWASPRETATSALMELTGLKGILMLIRFFFKYAKKSIILYVITKHAVKEEVHNAGRAGIGGPDHVWGIIRECSPEELTFG